MIQKFDIESALSEIDGITSTQAKNFAENGISTVSDFMESSEEVLLQTKGVGTKSLEKISSIIQTIKKDN